MRKGSLGTIAGLLVAFVVAVATVFLSYYRLKVPQIPLDWVALVFSGLTTGCLAFFIVWGHFQKDPEPNTVPLCPACGGTLTFKEFGQTGKGVILALVGHLPLGEVAECEKCHWKSTDIESNKRIARHRKVLEEEKKQLKK